MIKFTMSKIKRILKHELIGGASIIFFGSLATNFFNFFFNLFMTRNLSESEYGILASLLSLMTLATLPAGAFIPTLVRFSASYFAKGEIHLVRGLFVKVTKLSFFFGGIIFILSLVFVDELKEFIKVNDTSLILLASVSIFFGIIQVVNVALLQAKLLFSFIAFTNLLSAVLKLALGIALVFMNTGVKGGMSAYFIAGIIPYGMSFYPLRSIFREKSGKIPIQISKLLTYAAPSSLALFSLTSFISTDILLVKHFFNPLDAGIYATLSLVGRVIFFFSAPITTVMFPLIVQKHARDENFHNIFKLSLLFVFLPSFTLTIFYFLFPDFSLHFFSTKASVSLAAPYLGLFGLFITAYSLLYVIVNFYLSIKQTQVFIPVVLGAVLQAVLIWFFHDTFLEVILVSLAITSLLLILLLLYYLRRYGKKKY